MQVKEVTFSCTRSIPLMSITHDPTDEYASVRPHASCTIEVNIPDDANAKTSAKLVKDAYAEAQEHVTSQLADFYTSMVAAFAPKGKGT